MKQGVLSATRVRLLLNNDSSCYRSRRVGERKRKSVRGCIVSSDMSVLNLVIKKKGDADIEGLTDSNTPRRLGPKRANKIRKLFNLGADDDVRKSVITRKFTNKAGKEIQKRPNVQRLVTPITLKRKAARAAASIKSLQKGRSDRAEYAALLQKRIGEQKEQRRSEISKRRSSRKASQKE